MALAVHPFINATRVAYFSMEIAIRPEMHTYSGGLGVLAGDTARSCSDLELPVVFVTLVSRAGYFRQGLDANGAQTEQPDWWNPADWCVAQEAMVAVQIEGRDVWIRPWLYVHASAHGHKTPILLLDTDHDLNDPADREITHYLYGGDEEYRLKQEVVLGIGGMRILRALGFDVQVYHLNEGHAALLTLELLDHWRASGESEKIEYDLAAVRQRCVFTTHTPVEAGHDRFSYDLVERLLPDMIDPDTLKALAGADRLNMTRLALGLAGYTNGVARRHAETTRRMFPGYRIHAVTNGVHPVTWTHEAFARLYDEYMPRWRHEPEVLVAAMRLPTEEVWNAHVAAKKDFVADVKERAGTTLDPELPTLCFARRMTGYKRPDLIFEDLQRLVAIAEKHPFQLVFAGKAHPHDQQGRNAIREIHDVARRLEGKVPCVFLPGYDMQLAASLVSGADIWLNTPRPPMEASGTSGMKAAFNGVINFSVLDGWWAEACVEGVTGWAIGPENPAESDGDAQHAASLYDKLENIVLPLFHDEQAKWRWTMTQSIGSIAYYFNSHRMMRRYASEAYLR